jgi:hypothetical protein
VYCRKQRKSNIRSPNKNSNKIRPKFEELCAKRSNATYRNCHYRFFIITTAGSLSAYHTITNASRDTSYNTVTGFGLVNRGSFPGRDKKYFLPHHVQVNSAAHPMGTGLSFTGVKRPKRKADHIVIQKYISTANNYY